MSSMSNCNITMNLDSSLAAELLARALLKQAEASVLWNEVALELAKSLKPTDICAVKFVSDEIAAPFSCTREEEEVMDEEDGGEES